MTRPDDREREREGVPSQRRTDRRRTYNRRAEDRELSPPYFEVFERIANALERIETALRQHPVTLPDVEVGPRPPKP